MRQFGKLRKEINQFQPHTCKRWQYVCILTIGVVMPRTLRDTEIHADTDTNKREPNGNLCLCHLHKILHKPFLLVSVLASVSGSVKVCTPEGQFTKSDCQDIYYKYKFCQVNPVSCCSSKRMYTERTC